MDSNEQNKLIQLQSTIEATKKIAEYSDAIAEKINNLGKQIVESLQPFIEQQKKLQETIENIGKPFIEQQKKFQEIFENIRKHFIESLQPFIEQQKKFQEIFEKIAKKTEQWKNSIKIVYEAGWWLSPSFLIATDSLGRLDQMQMHADRYKSGDKRAITSLFFPIYQNENCEYLISVVQEWKQNPYFKRWNMILDEALDSHIHKKYSVSIPALLLTAEGIATDYCKKKNIFNTAMKSRGDIKIETALEQTSKEKRELLLTDFFMQQLFSIIDNKIFEKTDKLNSSITRGYKHFLNRHAIMHGKSSKYGSLKNSLQCFLILDVLSLIS
jgi:hypothetical protein